MLPRPRPGPVNQFWDAAASIAESKSSKPHHTKTQQQGLQESLQQRTQEEARDKAPDLVQGGVGGGPHSFTEPANDDNANQQTRSRNSNVTCLGHGLSCSCERQVLCTLWSYKDCISAGVPATSHVSDVFVLAPGDPQFPLFVLAFQSVAWDIMSRKCLKVVNAAVKWSSNMAQNANSKKILNAKLCHEYPLEPKWYERNDIIWKPHMNKYMKRSEKSFQPSDGPNDPVIRQRALEEEPPTQKVWMVTLVSDHAHEASCKHYCNLAKMRDHSIPICPERTVQPQSLHEALQLRCKGASGLWMLRGPSKGKTTNPACCAKRLNL